MRTKRRRTGQSSSRSGAAREPPQQQQLPDDIEKENAAVLNKLPREVWEKIVGWLPVNIWDMKRDDHFPFAMTCRYFRDLRQDIAINKGSRFRTVLKSYSYTRLLEGDCDYCPTIDEAMWEGRLSVSADYLKWLFGETRSTYFREAALAARTWDGKPRFIAAQGELRVMELAAAKGDLDLIKWLRSQDPPCQWSKKACTAAAWANRWDLLRQLLSMGCPIDKGGIFGAVARDPGHSLPDTDWKEKFEILKWLQREQGCVFRGYAWRGSHLREVVKASIRENDLECLQWVRGQGVTWEECLFQDDVVPLEGDLERDLIYAYANVCYDAARLGRLKILRYAVEDGCPWDQQRCLEEAEKNKHEDVVKWITDRARQASLSESFESESEPASLSE